jgi:hypothetical protein
LDLEIVMDRLNSRRGFLQGTIAALGTAFLPSPAPIAHAQQADAKKEEESVDLPMVEVKSADPSLPGTWYILDRTKPIRKLVDRKSLLPVGRRTLMLIETTQTFTADKKFAECYLIAGMPADVGSEQTLLGCMPFVRTQKGDEIPFKAHFHQSKGHGGRVAQIIFEDCEADVPMVIGMRYVVFNAPVLSAAQKASISMTMSRRTGKRKKPEAVPGFPEPAFTEGGPQFVGAKPGPSQFQTIHNVLKATDQVIAYNGAPEFETADPDVAKMNKKGACGPRARVAEKALVGVARAAVVTLLQEDETTRHGFLLIVDPDTGQYFIGDVAVPDPFMCPHFGNCYIIGPYRNEGIPNLFKLDFDFDGPIVAQFAAKGDNVKFKNSTPLTLTGSSNPGFKNTAKCQAWLKKLPVEFRDLEKKLLKT